ncbi:MAG: hypothetical protein NZ518_02975 [Dehalococcoidia bacterium]|nr:hypothetical protein [Dehalococcoidia bacterium]
MESPGSQRAALWTLVGVVLGFKLVWAITLWSIEPSHEAWVMIVAQTWPFLLPLGLLAAPVVAWWRLVKVRAKRRALLAAEWRRDHWEDEASRR